MVTPEQRFFILLSIVSLLCGGIGVLLKLLWKVSTQWTRTGDQLEFLANEIRDLIQQKEKEHTRLEKADDALGKRLDRLEDWRRSRRA